MIFPAEEPAQNRRGESWHLPAARGARCGRVERRRGQRQRWSWAVGGPLPWPSRSPLTAPGSPPPSEGQGAVSSREEDSFGRGFGAGLSPGHPPVSLQGWVVFGPGRTWTSAGCTLGPSAQRQERSRVTGVSHRNHRNIKLIRAGPGQGRAGGGPNERRRVTPSAPASRAVPFVWL